MSLFTLPVKATEKLAQTQSLSIDDKINAILGPISDWIFKILFFPIISFGEAKLPFLIFVLAGSAIFFSVYFHQILFRNFPITIRIIKGRYSSSSDPGKINQFEALCTALSATVGIGNIAGVAAAIALGGPGAMFWMLVLGILGMSLKFAECTLGVKYREISENGHIIGGPMYYLKKGLQAKGLPLLGSILAIAFSIFCVGGTFGAGNMFQINQAGQLLTQVLGGADSFLANNLWLFGLVISVLVGLVIIGGIKRIAYVTSKLVPVMCVIYIIACLVILFSQLQNIPQAFGTILAEAFNPQSFKGGLLGVIVVGVQRAVFSNEAGLGSASIAHAAVKTRFPASEGFVGSVGPFIDTVVVCSMTALVIVVSGVYAQPDAPQGIALTSSAFATSIISWFPYVLSIATILFALSTVISWSYYGLQAWTYLLGTSKIADLSYKILFCAIIIMGSSLKLESILNFSDALLLSMAFPNLIGIYFLLPVIKEETRKFRQHMKQIDQGTDSPPS